MMSTRPDKCALQSQDWELPQFEVGLFTERRHDYALVIPVINEGERIRKQLLKIRDACLSVDVIVADGGSSDGSLDASFIVSAGVRAVLTKKGPGKLSAQLRMAYAWSLLEGYAGIVTIDGNGKDGVEAIAQMVEKLREGYDYVQGSRYLPGGAAENTPFERTVANRGIHAPMLSLAGKNWYTDTTNGFRAYSADYLLDPRVQPFREVFQSYELLFYLTVRAGQIGKKICQIPVSRSYPANGKVPTKINGISSKLKVLAETVSAATGSFTPNVPPPPKSSWMRPTFFILLAVFPWLVIFLVSPNYSPDSWAYYELGQTVFQDFYRFEHFRAYWSDSPYSASFPPLLPVLIAALDAVLNTGARSGIYIALMGFLGFALLSEKIGRNIFGVAWLGLGSALLLLLGQEMLLAELFGGRTIPLQLFLMSILLFLLIRFPTLNMKAAAALGLVAGIAVLNRFDAIFLPLLLAFAIGMLTKTPRLGLISFFCSAAVLLPWVAYSVNTFGIAFATDNAQVALSIDPKAFVTDWWPVPQPLWLDHPAAWLHRLSGNSWVFLRAFFKILGHGMVVVFLLTLFLIFFIQRLSNLKSSASLAYPDEPSARKALFVFLVILALQPIPQVLTGYTDFRYFTALFWCSFLALGGRLISRSQSNHQKQCFANIFFIFISLAVITSAVVFFARVSSSGKYDGVRWESFESPADVTSLAACLQHEPDARILVLGDNTFAAQAGALAKLSTLMEPRNMADGRLDPDGSRAFLKAWEVSHVLVANVARLSFAANTFDLEMVSNCSQLRLFKVVNSHVDRTIRGQSDSNQPNNLRNQK